MLGDYQSQRTTEVQLKDENHSCKCQSCHTHTHTHTHTHKHLKSFSVQQSYILKTCLHIQERFGKSICCIFYVSLTLLWLLQLISSPWLMKVISALLSAIPSAATTVQFLPNSTQLVGAKATGKIINFTLQV